MTTLETERPRLGSSAFALLELMRFPNLFTAMADVTMGFLFVRGLRFDEDTLQPILNVKPNDLTLIAVLALASASLYAAGSILNDVFDFAVDSRERPGRPLPSGRVSRGFAAAMGIVLLLVGLGLAGWVAFTLREIGPAAVAGALVLCILFYDAWAKNTVLGPIAMGLCRAANVLLGMSILGFAWGAPHAIVAGAVGLYITGVTWLARTEAEESNRVALAGATIVLLAGVGLLATLGVYFDVLTPTPLITLERWHLFISVLGLLIGWRCFWAIVDPRPFTVQTAVRQCILSLVMLDAAACFASCGIAGVFIVLPFLVPAMVFSQFIRST